MTQVPGQSDIMAVIRWKKMQPQLFGINRHGVFSVDRETGDVRTPLHTCTCIYIHTIFTTLSCKHRERYEGLSWSYCSNFHELYFETHHPVGFVYSPVLWHLWLEIWREHLQIGTQFSSYRIPLNQKHAHNSHTITPHKHTSLPGFLQQNTINIYS